MRCTNQSPRTCRGGYSLIELSIAMVLLAIVLGLGPLAAKIPHAVLAGILIKVGIDIIDWGYLKRVPRAPRYSTGPRTRGNGSMFSGEPLNSAPPKPTYFPRPGAAAGGIATRQSTWKTSMQSPTP